MKHWCIVGLGNPGEKYEKTRHNAGFLALDYLKNDWFLSAFSNNRYHKALESSGTHMGHKITLVKPQTFMNLSGETVRALLKDVPLEQIILIYDDIDLPVGSIRVRQKGRAGSHNGMKSVIQHAGSDTFSRVRIGIRPVHPISNLADFVLNPFPSSERNTLESTFADIVESVELILQGKLDLASRKFNSKIS